MGSFSARTTLLSLTDLRNRNVKLYALSRIQDVEGMGLFFLAFTQLEEEIRRNHQDHPPPADCPRDHLFVTDHLVEKVLSLSHKS